MSHDSSDCLIIMSSVFPCVHTVDTITMNLQKSVTVSVCTTGAYKSVIQLKNLIYIKCDFSQKINTYDSSTFAPISSITLVLDTYTYYPDDILLDCESSNSLYFKDTFRNGCANVARIKKLDMNTRTWLNWTTLEGYWPIYRGFDMAISITSSATS